MARNNSNHSKGLSFCLSFLFVVSAIYIANAQDSQITSGQLPKNLVLGIGAGYGVSNNPCHKCESEEQLLTGPSFALSLGYKINSRFKIDFGPSVWIEGKDVFQKNGNASDRPANKRMLISLNGYYYPIKNNLLNIKLGAGIGNLIYTPDKNLVILDTKTYDNTEFVSGFAATLSIIYGIQLTKSFTIHPSLNLWFNELDGQKNNFESHVNTKKTSITSDFKLNVFFDF